MTQNFDNVVFPSRLAFSIDSVAEVRVDITRLASGYEQRNTRWSQPRRKYIVALGQRPIAEAQELLAFFEARNGPLRSFKFRDPMHNSTAVAGASVSANNVNLGLGDGQKTDFELRDRNGRRVMLPVLTSLKIGVGGAEITTGYMVLPDGTLRFGTPPNSGSLVTAGFEFFIAVRFENDQLIASRTTMDTASISDINLVEVHL
ncbi:MAG: TIGR02217 family protein [Ahrensia sp.]|nr:TIGR02217 family protein [Ahrensia sp.]